MTTELKFWLTFLIVLLISSIVTTMKVLYEGIKSTDEETCKKLLESINKRAHDIIIKYLKLRK